VKKSDPQAVEIIDLCREMGFVISELDGGIMIEFPSFKQFLKGLPPSGAQEQVSEYRRIEAFLFSRFRIPDMRRRWKIWHTGTVRIDIKLK
jgi:hypothetical protein